MATCPALRRRKLRAVPLPLLPPLLPLPPLRLFLPCLVPIRRSSVHRRAAVNSHTAIPSAVVEEEEDCHCMTQIRLAWTGRAAAIVT